MQQCVVHKEISASGTCAACGKAFCEKCLVDVNGKKYCQADVGPATKAQPNKS